MTNSKNILLISYTFPPYPGIGGRRWAKFAKYLAKAGYTVHVVCAKNPFDEVSLWQDDVITDNIIIHELDGCYPTILLKQPKTIFGKINYRLSLFFVKLFSKGTPYDKGIFWKNKMLNQSKKIIRQHRIKNVIVSCAPFSSAYQSLELKKTFPAINLMIDLRDPWTWGSGYGFSMLSRKRLQFEKQKEKSVMELTNNITVPVQIMKKEIVKLYPEHEKKISCLFHAFDKDEITLNKNISNKKKKIIFYGSLYKGIEHYIKLIAKSFSKLNENIELHIYSDSESYSEIFVTEGLLNVSVFYFSSLPTKKLFVKISEADFVLLIHPDYGINNISTKFYEIIYSRTPIIYIGEEGIAAQFVLENEIGYTFNEANFPTKFKDIIHGIFPYPYNKTYNVNDFSFENITQKLTDNYLVK